MSFDRIVLVAATSRPSGAEVAEGLTLAGVRVVTRDVRDLDAVRATLIELGARLAALVSVVGDEADLDAALEAGATAMGLQHPLALVHVADPALAPEKLTRSVTVATPPGIRVNAVAAKDATAETVARLVAFLISEEGASLDGQVLLVTDPGKEPPDDAVVVVGMGLAVPGASTPEEFWELLTGGEPVFGEPGDRLDLDAFWSADPGAEDRTYSRVSGFMTGFRPHPRLRDEIASGAFDSGEFTALWLRHSLLSAVEGVTIRPQDRRLFAVGLTPDGSHHLEQSLVTAGVRAILAGTGTDVPDSLAELYPLAAEAPEDLLPYRIARMAAHDLPEAAEIVVVDTACSSSLYSVDLGVRALRSGETDVALCGGAFALGAQNLVLFSKLRGLSRSGRVRALDQAADGVLFSDSAAVLVLKTHARAVADGDPVLGFVAGFGGSSDGRGKAIYAPNAAGQRIALERAWAAADVGPSDVDWVVAHATGTPTGDRTEMTALTLGGGPDKRWTLTSNKSLVGHSGWAAGAVSAIHALLAVRHGVIPAQRQFSRLPDGVETSIHVPVSDLPWPATPDRVRTVGVSAMGFGGTNSHLILTDRAGRRGAAKTPAADPIVIVAAEAHLPGDPGRERIDRWLDGGAADWPTSFGADYPLPSPLEARLAPSAIAAMDRTQLMALRCADRLAGEWTKDENLAARTAVLVGHTGPTRSALGYDLRCYLGELTARLTGPAGLPPELLGDAVRAMSSPVNEDAYPGLMPNVIAARVVQRLDLHGPNMTLDAGRDSVNSALATAIRYLRDGEIDAALVIGVNATTDHVRAPHGEEIAEACIGFVLTRESLAKAHNLPSLGTVDLAPTTAVPTPAPLRGRNHRGAEGAVSLLRALRAGQTVLQPVEDAHTPALLVTPEPPGDQGLRGHLTRHALVLRPVAARAVRPVTEAIPAGTLILTDDSRALADLELPVGCLVAVPHSAPREDTLPFPVVHLDEPEQLERHLAGRHFGQVRVIAGAQRPGTHVSQSLLDLHDLAFVAARACATDLDAGGCYAVLALAAMTDRTPVPAVGLFGGLVRSLSQELTGCLMFALVTDTDDTGQGLHELAEETAAHRHIPVAYRAAGRRLELMLVPAETSADDTALPADPVIVATGGARGLTAHLVEEVATDRAPRGVWLLGTGPAPDRANTDPPPPRREALRELMTRHPSDNAAALGRRYDRAVHEHERLTTLQRLERLCGHDRVHYRQCDVLDEAAVQKTMDEILAVEGRVDVLVHGAGLARSAGLARKKLADFQTVRDVKVAGYAHLRAALGERRPALWCSVSSVSAFTGLRGEPDYGGANEFLLLAAAHARETEGLDEVALVSGLWVESGMASADTPGGAFLARQGEIGQLTDVQGREFFRRELRDRGSHGLATTWIGDTDWATLQRNAPGFRDACLRAEPERPRRASLPPRRDAFLTGPPDPDGHWSVEVGLDEHPYLLDHLVDGRPTLPGTFVLEMGAEAAAALAPGLVPVRVTDVVLSRFIRAVRHRWPRTLRVSAVRDGRQVRVRVSTPAAGPVPEQEHSRMVVHLADRYPLAPWCPPPATDRGVEAPDTYALPGSPVELSGVFGALRNHRLEPDGGSAELRLTFPAGGGGGIHSRFALPSVALDCVLRTSVLDGGNPGEVPVIVPTALGSVELYGPANDLDLAAAWPEGLPLRHWSDPATGEVICALAGADGRALLRVRGISGAVKGRYDPGTGTWRSETV
ncbi:MAG: SDR family oxidoreductase [Streptosporangiaceae bacterium]